MHHPSYIDFFDEVLADTRAMVEGLNMIRGQLESVLHGHGLSEIPSLGETSAKSDTRFST